MHRFFLPPDQCVGMSLVLTGREAHHALHVVRLQSGETVSVLDGVGGEYVGGVEHLGRDTVRIAVRQKNSIPRLPFELILVQAIPKGKAFETVIQKATELGAARIVPVVSERVVQHVSDGKAESKLEKWRQVAVEAIKQCGSAWLPRLEPPVPLRTFLTRFEAPELSLVASLQAERRHPRSWFARFVEENGRKPVSVAVWVGPEGDFTAAELSEIKAVGALPITLGAWVLRSETAALYCLSVLNYELQTG